MGRWDWGQLTAAVFYFAAAGVISYLGLSGLQGDYGLWALTDARQTEVELEAELEAALADEAVMANRVARLSSRSLDLELLDERARDVLGLVRPDELVVE